MEGAVTAKARTEVTEHPEYGAYKHARGLRDAGLSVKIACRMAGMQERTFYRLRQLDTGEEPGTPSDEIRPKERVRHSDSRPHEEYGDAELPSVLGGRVRTNREPAPLPADWQPPSRPTEDDMGKRKGRNAWVGERALAPHDELAEIQKDIEEVITGVDEPEDLEDAAAVEFSDEEQAAIARGERPEETYEERRTEVLFQEASKVSTQEERDADAERQLAEHHPLTGVSDGTRLGDELAEMERADPVVAAAADSLHKLADKIAEDVSMREFQEGRKLCGHTVLWEGKGYICRSERHSPIQAHDFVELSAEDTQRLRRANEEMAASGLGIAPTFEPTPEIAPGLKVNESHEEDGVRVLTNVHLYEIAAVEHPPHGYPASVLPPEEVPDIVLPDGWTTDPLPPPEEVTVEPDIPLAEPEPAEPNDIPDVDPKDVARQKEKGAKEVERWIRSELPGYVQLVKDGYNLDTSVHFKRLLPWQLEEVRRASAR
jgi:hypothetical protein